MKKQILLIIGLCIKMMLQAQTASASSGSGTEYDPYQIATLENLYWLSQTYSVWDNYFIQTADIDASGTSSWGW
jgi:hypothetical protein